MTAGTSSSSGNDALAVALRKLYGSRSIRRDARGRRAALPSEIANVLAQAGPTTPCSSAVFAPDDDPIRPTPRQISMEGVP